jgi:predicted dehydrogenase
MDTKPIASETGSDTRRTFLKKTATAAAAVAATNLFKTPVYGQNQAPSAGVVGANERINVGIVGVGPQGTVHLQSIVANAGANNVAILGVSDLWDKRLETAKQTVGAECKGYKDYRQLLEQKDVHAILCATVDHWHAKVSIDAMKAGKHIYVEKPMSRYLPEAFEVYETVKQTKMVFQVGSQGCSDAKWQKAAELCKAGKLGALVLATGSFMRNKPKGEWNYDIDVAAKADTVDWKTWLGPNIKKRPAEFNADHFFRWRKYFPYCAGLLGDLFPHRVHPLLLATGNPEFPTRVVAIGTKKVGTDKKTPGTPERDSPEFLSLLAEFPSGLTAMVCASSVTEQGLQDCIRGQMATLYIGGNRVDLKPEPPFSEDIDPEAFPNLQPVESFGIHEKNWFDCIRSGKQPNANIELAIRVQTIVSLGEMSDRMGTSCVFDEKTRKVRADGKVIDPITYGSLDPS